MHLRVFADKYDVCTRNIKLLLFLLYDNPRIETTSQVTCIAKQI